MPKSSEALKKVFALDVLACPDCGGRLQIVAFVADDAVARRILLHMGLDSRGPPVARAQAPPEFPVRPGPVQGHRNCGYPTRKAA